MIVVVVDERKKIANSYGACWRNEKAPSRKGKTIQQRPQSQASFFLSLFLPSSRVYDQNLYNEDIHQTNSKERRVKAADIELGTLARVRC